jgi:hypothetical protein
MMKRNIIGELKKILQNSELMDIEGNDSKPVVEFESKPEIETIKD